MDNIPLALTFDDVLLVPQFSEVCSRKEVVLQTKLSPKKNLILSLPVISANMDTVTDGPMAKTMAQAGGLGIIHRFMAAEKQAEILASLKSSDLLVGAAFGVKEGELDRARLLVEAGADLLLLDIAHGHCIRAIETIKVFRKEFPDVFLLAGNVATPEGVSDLAKAGADAVKIGIGGGSVCTTRIKTGFGVPLITSLLMCAPMAKKMEVGLVADGGIRYPGDVVKALAAGAEAVMVGNMLAGSDQTPGEKIIERGVCRKEYRGMASYQANFSRSGGCITEQEVIVEGVSGFVPCRGDASLIIQDIKGGLSSGLSYAGAHNLKELREKARFVRVTSAGKKENGPHDIEMSDL
jgi:IMP dehydrogenase